MTRARLVDARFAGGLITVEDTMIDGASDRHGVTVSLPLGVLTLFPHEATQLAAALVECASPQPRELRRAVSVDAQLKELEP